MFLQNVWCKTKNLNSLLKLERVEGLGIKFYVFPAEARTALLALGLRL